jgi:osmoprotectant transport system ATP-binding protein
MIELDRIVKEYQGRRVVDDLSFTVPEGAFCVLLGTSGCGKSTTLRMINRLVPFDGGTIRIEGTDVREVAPETLRRRIGYAIQSTGLFPHWTIEQNICTVPRLLDWPQSRIRDRVTELLQLFRLDPETYRHKHPHQLSGGEQQRVGVARALAADPDLLLMDEPFGAVDPLTRDALQAEMTRIHEATGKTIVFVTHDIAEALRLATVIAVMDRGRLAQWGTPLDILENPANDFVAGFVGGETSGVQLLALRTVAERLRLGEDAEGEPIAAEATLRDALAAMMARHTDRLPVADGEGRRLGAIALADLIR